MRAYNLLLLTLLVASQLIASSASPDCAVYANGVYLPDPQNCARYYMCRNGRAIRRRCGRGLYFDTNSHICNFAALVDCYDGRDVPFFNPSIVQPLVNAATTTCPQTTTTCPTTKTTTCPATTTTCPTTTTTCPTTKTTTCPTTTTTTCPTTTTTTTCPTTTTTTCPTTTTTTCPTTTTTTTCPTTTTTCPTTTTTKTTTTKTTTTKTTTCPTTKTTTCPTTKTTTCPTTKTTTSPTTKTTTTKTTTTKTTTCPTTKTTTCPTTKTTTCPTTKTTTCPTTKTTTCPTETINPELKPKFIHYREDCAYLNDGTFVLDENHCRRYYVCRRGRARRLRCRAGLWFDYEQRSCRNLLEVTNCPANRN